MKKREGFNKFIGIVVLLAVLTFLKRWFDYSYILVWMGVLVGFYMPFLDHLFYAYILRPETEVSKNIRVLVTPKKLRSLVEYVNETRDTRERLVIHTAHFQIVFLLLTFYVLSSSGGLFGRGLVYGMCASLLAEQILQFIKTKELTKWFLEIPVNMDTHKTKVYLYANGLVLLIFSLML